MAFPTDIVDALSDEMKATLAASVVLRRPLRPTDPDGSVGIIAADWVPNAHVIGQHDPAVGTYAFQIQAFVKHADEESGRQSHTDFANRVRLMLYRNAGLAVRLGSLVHLAEGFTERVQRWGIRQQRFAANEVGGEFLYLSTTEFWVETETV